jgi:hypothetical protein
MKCVCKFRFLFRQIRRYVQYCRELEQGINFSIVELNGAASEPTHIYDPKHSLFCMEELARHITYMYEISTIKWRYLFIA